MLNYNLTREILLRDYGDLFGQSSTETESRENTEECLEEQRKEVKA